jgi:hypothetical protein
LELGDELRRPDDRPRHQLREERHKQGKVEQRVRRLRTAQVHVERVRHGLERVEGDSDREHDVPIGGRPRHPDRGHQDLPVLEQELSVLEVAEQAEVYEHADSHPPATPRQPILGVDLLRYAPVDDRRDPQQDHERGIPGGVEYVARQQEVCLLDLPRERRVVKRKHQREEDEEREGIEEQRGLCILNLGWGVLGSFRGIFG